MLGENNGKGKVLKYFVFFVFILLNCVSLKANEPVIYVRANINERHRQFNEVMSKYGDIWIGYTIASNTITTTSREERFIIERANYYFKKDGIFILMGSVDKTGLYDKNRTLLRETPRNIAAGFQVAGISSQLIDMSSLTLYLILQSTTNSNIYHETEAYVFIDFDIENDTIKLRDMSMFFGP
jgi:hypothetical protein